MITVIVWANGNAVALDEDGHLVPVPSAHVNIILSAVHRDYWDYLIWQEGREATNQDIAQMAERLGRGDQRGTGSNPVILTDSNRQQT